MHKLLCTQYNNAHKIIYLTSDAWNTTCSCTGKLLCCTGTCGIIILWYKHKLFVRTRLHISRKYVYYFVQTHQVSHFKHKIRLCAQVIILFTQVIVLTSCYLCELFHFVWTAITLCAHLVLCAQVNITFDVILSVISLLTEANKLLHMWTSYYCVWTSYCLVCTTWKVSADGTLGAPCLFPPIHLLFFLKLCNT